MPSTSVITFGTYVSSGNSSGRPTGCHRILCSSNSGPRAKPSAGSRIAEVAMAPVAWTVPTMKRRRVTVSPSNAPGMPRSAVYLLLACFLGTVVRVPVRGTRDPAGRRPGPEIYRSVIVRAAPPAPGVSSAGGRHVSGDVARRCGQTARRRRIACTRGLFAGAQVARQAPAQLGAPGRPDGVGQGRVARGLGLRGQRDEVRQCGD